MKYLALLLLPLGTVGQTQEELLREWLYLDSLAIEMLDYDYTAWHTSDSLTADTSLDLSGLKGIWFCFRDENRVWNATYGRIENSYIPVVSYKWAGSGYKEIEFSPADSLRINSLARITRDALQYQDSLIRFRYKIQFNRIILANTATQTMDVYILPAWQRDGSCIWGSEWKLVYDMRTFKRLRVEVSGTELRSKKPDQSAELTMDYTAHEKMPASALFYARYYAKAFSKVNIISSGPWALSTLVTGKDSEVNWIHLERQPEKKSKKKGEG